VLFSRNLKVVDQTDSGELPAQAQTVRPLFGLMDLVAKTFRPRMEVINGVQTDLAVTARRALGEHRIHDLTVLAEARRAHRKVHTKLARMGLEARQRAVQMGISGDANRMASVALGATEDEVLQAARLLAGAGPRPVRVWPKADLVHPRIREKKLKIVYILR
jgi:hypothetical protein